MVYNYAFEEVTNILDCTEQAAFISGCSVAVYSISYWSENLEKWRALNNHISGSRWCESCAKDAEYADVAGAVTGVVAGGYAGATAGTFTVPGVGTVVGAAGGAMAGMISGAIGGSASSAIH